MRNGKEDATFAEKPMREEQARIEPKRSRLGTLLGNIRAREPIWNESTDSVFSAFQTVARRYPKKIALEAGDRVVTYAALYDRACKVSHLLLQSAKSDRGRIALLFTDRINAIVAILASLRAGMAYILLDADDPEERIRFVLNDSEPAILLTDDDHFNRARKLAGEKYSLLHIDRPLSEPESRNIGDVDPNSLAYIFYTSGSTGQPKGVTQTQRNLLYFVRCYSRMLGITHKDRLSFLYSLSFSAANMDIFGGLLAGATVCAYDTRKSGISQLATWLSDEKISILHAVPTVFRKLASNQTGRRFKFIRAVDLGGELVSASDVELFRKTFHTRCRLVNHLAATEASVIAQYCVEPAKKYEGDIPVGRSPQGVEVKIEKADGTGAQENEVGHLVISSPFLSPGYWRRPDLNEIAFGAGEQSGWRTFRTRDLGRIGPDRLLYFVGRDDSRVKVRGHTLDIAEVEAGVRRCAGVLDVAVIARDSQSSASSVLVAYVVMAHPQQKDANALRQQLRRFLPAYMLPSSFVFLDALPFTTTGKIDRRALADYPAPASSNGSDAPDPTRPYEKEIAEIFCDLLQQTEIGRSSDFFFSGGDSMSLPDLQVLLSDLVRRDVALNDILSDTTVAGLAKTLRNLASRAETSGSLPLLVPLRESGTGPILFLVHGLFGQAHVGRHLLDLAGEDQRVYALQARGVDGREKPHSTLEAMARDYVDAIRKVRPEGPYFIVTLCAGAYIGLLMATMLRNIGEQVLPLILIDPPVPPLGGRVVSRRDIDSLLKRNAERGRFRLDTSTMIRRQGAQETALKLIEAINKFEPTPYQGEVYMLVNATRYTNEGWRNPSKQASCFSGSLEIFEVASNHAELFDVYNEAFADCFEECIRRVRTSCCSYSEKAVSKE